MPIVLFFVAMFVLLWIGHDHEQKMIAEAQKRCAASDATLIYTNDRKLICVANSSIINSR